MSSRDKVIDQLERGHVELLGKCFTICGAPLDVSGADDIILDLTSDSNNADRGPVL